MALITISRSMGSGDLDIARRVAEALDLELFDDRRLKEKALAMGIRSEDLKGLDEKAPGFFDRLLSQKPETYLDLLESVVYATCREGNGVVVGHGSQVLLKDFDCAFHVLVHASEKTRIGTVSRDKGVTKEVAKRLVRKNDSERRGFFRWAFSMQWDAPNLYDLVINPEKIGADATGELIIQSARSEGVKACSLGALERMERLSLQKRVTAALKQEDVLLRTLVVEVQTPGTARIRGVVGSERDRRHIIDTTSGVSGVERVEAEIVVVDIAAE